MSAQVNGSSGKPSFELPALDFNFGSITDGTIIPPPESPKVPTPPQTPPPTNKPDEIPRHAVVNVSGNGVVKETQTDDDFTPPNGNMNGTKRKLVEPPLSPIGSTRQASLRRLFSKSMLNATYADGNLASLENGSRPPSLVDGSVVGGRKSKRNSWFKFFNKGGESKRSSMLFLDDAAPPKTPIGPPPPMIPELRDLEKEEGSLGNDLFKNIKG